MFHFEMNILCQQGFKNVVENGKIVGFQLRTKINYYRGICLPLIDYFEVDVDGEYFGPETISFSVDGVEFFTLDECKKRPDKRWEYGQKGYVRVTKPGGLTQGMHTVRLTQRPDICYLPKDFVSLIAIRERKMTIV